MRIRPTGMALGFALALACIAPAVAGTRELPPGAVLVEPGQWNIPEGRDGLDATEVLRNVARNDAAGAFARMQGWSDPARFELAAVRVIDALQAQPATTAAGELLAMLEREPVRLYRRHEETAADWFVPLFDIPARAAGARRLLAFVEAQDALITHLQQDPRAALGKGRDSPQTIAAALERAPGESIERIAALALAGDIDLPSPAWVALARRKPDPAILQATLDRAQEVDALPLLGELPATLAADVAFAWLQQAARMPAYASSAVLGLGVLAPRSPAAEAELARHLGTPLTGSSAAAALARLAVPDRVARIARLLDKAHSPAVVTDLALALRLEGSETALERLRALESDPRLPAEAKAELQR